MCQEEESETNQPVVPVISVALRERHNSQDRYCRKESIHAEEMKVPFSKYFDIYSGLSGNGGSFQGRGAHSVSCQFQTASTVGPFSVRWCFKKKEHTYTHMIYKEQIHVIYTSYV